MRCILYYLVFSFMTSASGESSGYYKRLGEYHQQPLFVAHAQNLASPGKVACKERTSYLSTLNPTFPSTSSLSNNSGNTFNAFFPAFENGEEADFTLAPLQDEPSKDRPDNDAKEPEAPNTETLKDHDDE